MNPSTPRFALCLCLCLCLLLLSRPALAQQSSDTDAPDAFADPQPPPDDTTTLTPTPDDTTTLTPTPAPTSVPTLPALRAPGCNTFRANLRSHTDLTHFDRRHARRLAIAALVLCWSGVPALPLAIAGLWTAHRISTPARQAMLDDGVTPDNFAVVNRLCAILLGTTEVDDPSFAGTDRAAVAMAAVALAVSVIVIVIQLCYGFVACFAPRYDDLKDDDPRFDDSLEDEEDDEDLLEEDEVQDERIIP